MQYILNHWHPHTTYQSHNHKEESALLAAVELEALSVIMNINRKKREHTLVGDFKADRG